MSFHSLMVACLSALSLLFLVSAIPIANIPSVQRRDKDAAGKIAPKVFIVSMFAPEAEIWWGIPEFDLLAHNISVPGLSPILPYVHCTSDYTICQLITGESEINAASTVTSVVFSDLFDLTRTYFFIAGIAGINPEVATTGSVTFARFAVQVALQYELDPREIPANYSTGYIPQGAHFPDQYPLSIYGTEVFEVNQDLRSLVAALAKAANLSDSETAQKYRAQYVTSTSQIYQAGAAPPSVAECDVATSDVYYSGEILGSTFANTTKLFTNGTGTYCATAQEDNATLEALLRSTVYNRTDFSRIIVMRVASDFDRPYPGGSAIDNLLYAEQGGFGIAIDNVYLAGIKVVEGILQGWNTTYAAGVKPSNYIGDIFGTLGGTPDFGPGQTQTLEEGHAILSKRSMPGRRRRRYRW